MQLAANQLTAHLAKGLRSLYTVHGDEPLLVQEAAMLTCVDRARSERVGVSNRRGWWLVPAPALQSFFPAMATP